MKIEINQPVCLNEKGKREYSEDYIFPEGEEVKSTDRTFLVCDGVGGSARGDMASKEVSTMFPKIIEAFRSKNDSAYGVYEKEEIEDIQTLLLGDALRATEIHLDKKVAEHPEFHGMATTLTYLHFIDQGAVIAWAGDSRVYHFRADGYIKYVTKDHSLVAQLLKRGEINAEQALKHPRRNVILRAVSGSENPTKVDVHFIPYSSIQAGDFFLLCTDGILEAVSDKTLSELVKSKPLEVIKEVINTQCEQLSKDNYSMYLIRVERVQTASSGSAKTEPTDVHRLKAAALAAAITEKTDDDLEEEASDKKQKGISKKWWILLVSFLIAAILANLYFWFKQRENDLINTKLDEIKKELADAKNKSIKQHLAVFESIEQEINDNPKLRKADIRASLKLAFEDKERLERRKNRLFDQLEVLNSEVEARYNSFTDTLNQGNIKGDLAGIGINDPEISKIKEEQRAICKELGRYEQCDNLPNLIKEKEQELEQLKESLKIPIAISVDPLEESEDLDTEDSNTATSSEADVPNPAPVPRDRLICGGEINRSKGYWRKFSEVKCVHEGYVQVKMRGKWGFSKYINETNGEDLYHPTTVAYDEVGPFQTEDKVAWVKKGNKEGYVTVSKFLHPDQLPFEWVERTFGATCPGYVKFKKLNGEEGFMDTKGLIININTPPVGCQ